MLTGQPDYDDCVEAMKLGAFHYLRKPTEPALIEETLPAARSTHVPAAPGNAAFRRMHGPDRLPLFIGESPAAHALVERIRQVAPTTARVIITGESGTGKGLLARMLHEHRRRHGQIVHGRALRRDPPRHARERAVRPRARRVHRRADRRSGGCSSWPTAARCSWTSSPRWARRCRRSSSRCWRAASSAEWAGRGPCSSDVRRARGDQPGPG